MKKKSQVEVNIEDKGRRLGRRRSFLVLHGSFAL